MRIQEKQFRKDTFVSYSINRFERVMDVIKRTESGPVPSSSRLCSAVTAYVRKLRQTYAVKKRRNV